MKCNLVILSGAGISAESGIKTFRDADGLWENHSIEEVATPEAWKNNPTLLQRFYNERRLKVISSNPNLAHHYFKELQEHFHVQIITQNIDDLHERAGNSNVLHLHGNIRYAKSSGPNPESKYYLIEGHELKMTDFCDDGFPLRPHVVWFGEEVPLLSDAAEIIKQADIFIVIGTSLQVYPAARLIHNAPKKARKIVVDPAAKKLNISTDYIILNCTAEESVSHLKQILGH
ncbi:SIR2 family NAD-dependent protein deacylase [Fluviicola taffensis]|uniref:protein acetyllysine N-acetyltransferase n=1 Tax=Fluviicola taffensis (strain DSM 16823 / NCIMB 13979 / RW262) TaxID=755732 RepID=F2IIB0_FLUTR|nr:Sir2 family NAD-dependent protein deacetylase [Fluviicola taffensis]AEA43819.1 NAD-dependent deacetylase [Fluviicola taffensis DSM 16823]